MTSLFLWSGGRRASLLEGLLAVVAGCVVLLLGRELWVGGWKVAVDWGTGTLILIGPLCAGLSALAYSTMSAKRWDPFVAGMRRGWAAWLGPSAGVWLLGVVAMLACTAGAVGIASALGAHASPVMLAAVPLVAVTLAAEVGIGGVIGASLPRAVAVPLAVVVTFLLESLSVSGTIPGIFRTGGVTGDLAGQTYDFGVLGLQAAACLAIAAACALSLAFHVFPIRHGRSFVAVGSALALGALPWWALETGQHERYTYEASPRLVCKGRAPQVCLSQDTVRPLDALSSELGRQAAPLLELGIDLPDRFVQSIPGARRGAEGLVIFVDEGSSSSTADPKTVSLALATPNACPQFFSNRAPLRALRSRGLLADWIATQSKVPGIGVPAASKEGRWLRLPIAQQAEWLTATYAALRACRFGDLTIPF